MELLREDGQVVTWWGSSLECVSALHRLQREGALSAGELREVLGRLRAETPHWIEMQPSERLRQRAARLLGIHALRAADALQLAAALLAADEATDALDFVVSESRLSEAALSEGFVIR